MKGLIRQGDVLLRPIEELPSGLRREFCPDGRIVLAEGEVTGHAHVLEAEQVELVTAEEADELYLLVHGTGLLRHDEHDLLQVPAGAYRLLRQREYRPDAPPRTVSD